MLKIALQKAAIAADTLPIRTDDVLIRSTGSFCIFPIGKKARRILTGLFFCSWTQNEDDYDIEGAGHLSDDIGRLVRFIGSPATGHVGDAESRAQNFSS
jgi:hypothetical protein